MASNYTLPVPGMFFECLHITALSSNDSTSPDQSDHTEPIQIIGQPYCPSRLRYRSDFNQNQSRRAVLRSQNNPNHASPMILVGELLFFYRITLFEYLDPKKISRPHSALLHSCLSRHYSQRANQLSICSSL